MLREGGFISGIDRRTGNCFTHLFLFGSDFTVCGNLSISHIIFLLLNINRDMEKQVMIVSVGYIIFIVICGI